MHLFSLNQGRSGTSIQWIMVAKTVAPLCSSMSLIMLSRTCAERREDKELLCLYISFPTLLTHLKQKIFVCLFVFVIQSKNTSGDFTLHSNDTPLLCMSIFSSWSYRIGWMAFKQSRWTLDGVSSPDRVVRSMHVTAFSSHAVCKHKHIKQG